MGYFCKLLRILWFCKYTICWIEQSGDDDDRTDDNNNSVDDSYYDSNDDNSGGQLVMMHMIIINRVFVKLWNLWICSIQDFDKMKAMHRFVKWKMVMNADIDEEVDTLWKLIMLIACFHVIYCSFKKIIYDF